MWRGEKVEEMSKYVENAYVNQNAYPAVWKSPVEKVVDNVENSRVSTDIFEFYTAAQARADAYTWCITVVYGG